MKLSTIATGLSLAATLVFLFVVCAVAQAMFPSVQASHMWLSLFTAAPIGSAAAWVEGILANVIFGFIGGFFFAWVYNVAGQKRG